MDNHKFTTNKGATGRPFRVQIYGGAIDLTGYEATVTVWKKGATANKIDKKPMTLTDQSDKKNWGWFEYYPELTEVDEKGTFLAEVDVTRPDGKTFKVPAEASTNVSYKEYFDWVVLDARD